MKEGPIFDDRAAWSSNMNTIQQNLLHAIKWSWIWAGMTEAQVDELLAKLDKNYDFNIDDLGEDVKKNLTKLEKKGISKEMVLRRAKQITGAETFATQGITDPNVLNGVERNYQI